MFVALLGRLTISHACFPFDEEYKTAGGGELGDVFLFLHAVHMVVDPTSLRNRDGARGFSRDHARNRSPVAKRRRMVGKSHMG